MNVCSLVTFFGCREDIISLKENICSSKIDSGDQDLPLNFEKVIPLQKIKDPKIIWGVENQSINNKFLAEDSDFFKIAFETKDNPPKPIFEEISKKFPDIEIAILSSTEDWSNTWDLRYINGKLQREKTFEKDTDLDDVWEQAKTSPSYVANGSIKTFYNNGNVMYQTNYKNGEKNGYSFGYYSDNKLASMVHYKKNLLEGHCVLYDKNGKIEYMCEMKDDKKNGPAFYFKDGELFLIAKYQEGKEISNKIIQDLNINKENTTSCIKVKAKNLKNQKDQKNEIEM